MTDSTSPAGKRARPTRRINTPLTRRWMAVNTLGVIVEALIFTPGEVPRGAESRWLTALVVSIVLVLVGLFQTVLTITVISLVPIVGIRNKAILVAFGIMWAFVAAIFAMIAGSSLIGLYAYMGVYVFVPSGIVFGSGGVRAALDRELFPPGHSAFVLPS